MMMLEVYDLLKVGVCFEVVGPGFIGDGPHDDARMVLITSDQFC